MMNLKQRARVLRPDRLVMVALAVTALMFQACDKAASKSGAAQAVKPKINVLSYASSEQIVNIVRDQLSKAGFEVEVNLQPDSGSFMKLVENGSFELAVSGWTTVTGNPDYAVRSLVKTGADYNRGKIDDPEVNRLVDLAATQTPAEYVKTYGDLERRIIDEMAYFVPLYRGIKTQGVNIDVLDLSTVRISQARSMVWEKIEFNSRARNETDPVYLAQATGSLTSLDPIKANDGSINQLNSNMYIRVVNLTDDDKVIPDGSLSWQFSIKDGNVDYYFVLRDDVNFAKVENLQAVNTGVRVGGEDVVFSLSRARDSKSVPNHRTYTLHESMKEITLVTDLSELTDTRSSTGKTVKEELETRTPTAIQSLTASKTQANNKGGVYQVVKVTTNQPFPQVLNYLAHQSAGIVAEQQVKAINTYDVAAYDVTKDIAYGDQAVVTEGPSYQNHLWTSGPYIMIKKNDYQADFMRNPGYMPGTEYYPRIKNYVMRFIADSDSQLSALRAGEIYVLYSVPEAKIDLVKNDPKLRLQECGSNAVTYGYFNLATVPSVSLRRAILYSINQEEIIKVFDNRVFPAYSTLAPLVNTGNVLKADPAKAAQYLADYAAGK
ncbi:MAG: ABC transporter substrate-binding protein [Treponema sp.]|jgi:peptide/nickel transport system substrate-binding protein|nr:ABC transporter substrate-binding protein [Treponema sp.]